MKMVLHKEKCLGCGSCASVAPEIFELKEGVVKLKKEPDLSDAETLEQVKLAASLCPNEVIEIIED